MTLLSKVILTGLIVIYYNIALPLIAICLIVYIVLRYGDFASIDVKPKNKIESFMYASYHVLVYWLLTIFFIVGILSANFIFR